MGDKKAFECGTLQQMESLPHVMSSGWSGCILIDLKMNVLKLNKG